MNKVSLFQSLMVFNLLLNGACSVKAPSETGSSLESQKDVYIGGCSPKLEGDSPNQYYVCTSTLWKNQEPSFMEVDEISESIIDSIEFSGSDVYASGTIAGYATSWKNGLIHFKDSSNNSRANAIVADGETIYLGGSYFSPSTNRYAPEIWKNGIRQNIPDSYSEGQINSMVFHNGVLYAGGMFHVGNRDLANIWMMKSDNSISEVTLSNGSCDTKIRSMFLSEDTLYVLLRTCDSSQNDFERIITLDTRSNDIQSTALTQLEFSSQGGLSMYSLFVLAGNIFTVGSYDNFAHYWKNETATSLLDTRSVGKSIYVDGDDVHSVGMVQSNYDVATYWKNGEVTHLVGDVDYYSMANVIKLK